MTLRNKYRSIASRFCGAKAAQRSWVVIFDVPKAGSADYGDGVALIAHLPRMADLGSAGRKLDRRPAALARHDASPRAGCCSIFEHAPVLLQHFNSADRLAGAVGENVARSRAAAKRLRLAGVYEVAGLLGISKQALADRRRGERFPDPLVELRCGPIWDLDEVEAYARSYRRPAQWERRGRLRRA